MRIGPIAHGALLIAALVFGYQTWTRDKQVETKTGKVPVWDEQEAAFESLQYDEENKSVRIEARGEGGDRYLWGVVKTSRKAPPKPKDKDASKDPNQPQEEATDQLEPKPPEPEPAPEPEPEPEELITTTREFPIGEDGDELRKNIAALRALRELGKLDEKKMEEYGLAEGTDNLSVTFNGKSRTLIIGKRVFGGADRYVIDPQSGVGYVLSADIMNKVSGAEHSLGLKKMHGFEDAKLSKVVIKTPGGERTLLRSETEDPEKGKQTVWADKAAPHKPDLTLANFMDRVDKMRPTQYLPEVDPKSAKLIATIVYMDAVGKQIGFLELYRKEPSDGDKEEPPPQEGMPPQKPQVKYFIKTAKTRVLGEVAKMTAERAHQDFAEMFGAEPVPAPPPEPEPPQPVPGLGPAPTPGQPTPGQPAPDPHGHGDPRGGQGAPPPAPQPVPKAGTQPAPKPGATPAPRPGARPAAKPATKPAAGQPSKPAASPTPAPAKQPAKPTPEAPKPATSNP